MIASAAFEHATSSSGSANTRESLVSNGAVCVTLRKEAGNGDLSRLGCWDVVAIMFVDEVGVSMTRW